MQNAVKDSATKLIFARAGLSIGIFFLMMVFFGGGLTPNETAPLATRSCAIPS